MEKDLISIKGSHDGLVIHIEPEAGLSEMLSSLKEKLLQVNGYFDDSKVTLAFSGKQLSMIDKHELLEVIRQNSKMNIITVRDAEEPLAVKKPKSENPKAGQNDLKLKSKIVELNGLLQEAQSKKVSLHSGTLRSGQSVSVDSTLVLIGDVNSGAVINAGGSVIIVGKLRGGVVNCGLSGKDKAFVFALEMKPVLLRINNVYGRFDDSQDIESEPMVAYVQNEQIAIEPISNSVSKELEL